MRRIWFYIQTAAATLICVGAMFLILLCIVAWLRAG